MTEDEARRLAVLLEQAAHPDAHADARPRSAAHGWEVVLLWDQGPHSFGTCITELDGPSDESPLTVDRMALEIARDLVDEPQGPSGDVDDEGRSWLA